MNKQQAYQAMLEGKKICNSYFLPEEYLHLKNGVIATEDDYNYTDVFNEILPDLDWIEWQDPNNLEAQKGYFVIPAGKDFTDKDLAEALSKEYSSKEEAIERAKFFSAFCSEPMLVVSKECMVTNTDITFHYK